MNPFQVLKSARLNRREIAGSVGDMGLFIPLLVGMSSQNGLDFASALFFAGVFNIATGLVFEIPMAVQPMKAIAAVALTEGLTLPQILAAGIMVSAAILLLGLTGLIDTVNRWVPRPVVRGIQLGLGLSLAMKGFSMVVDTHVWLGLDSFSVALVAALVGLLLLASKTVPAALVLFVAGLIMAAWKTYWQGVAAWSLLELPSVSSGAGLHVGFFLPHWTPIALADFAAALPKAALPQIPLTCLNSVVAVAALSGDLFPGKEATPRKVAVSVGLMNLVGCWFGAMPMCHGAGGLAGQYRFGARTNGSILFLGTAKLLLAVFCGASLLALCKGFPLSILGVMLAFSGIELALVCRDQTARADAFVMLVTAGGTLALNNVGIGFLLGLAAALCLKFLPADVFGEAPKPGPASPRGPAR